MARTAKSLQKKYFEQEGYILVAQNHRYEQAEIDLIFKDVKKKALVFVEVKTQKSKTFGEPEESVTEHKQAQLIKSAEGFLMSHN